jgi:hypothetical protein
MDQPPGLWWRRGLGQSLVDDSTEVQNMPQEIERALRFLPAALAEGTSDRPFVAVVRTRDELCRWLERPLDCLQWIQAEELVGDVEAWALAAHGDSEIPLDVILSNPASEFSDLYRLVDVCAVRDVRVSMPAIPGFLKALKLAVSLQLPVRILPGQPILAVLVELMEALELYLHESMVEAPVEFFHSLLAAMCGAERGSLWMILEEDPAVFLHYDTEGLPRLPAAGKPWGAEISPVTWVRDRFQTLVDQGAECATCPWSHACMGFFKWPDPAYSCAGVKQLFSEIKAAADDIGRDLVSREKQIHSAGRNTL